MADAEWQALLHRALPQQAANEETGAAAIDAIVRAQGANTKAAAWPQRAWAAAAGVGALALLLNLVPRETEEAPAVSSHSTGAAKDSAGLRGGGGSDSALWRSKQPTQDAARLADALRAARAEVALVAGPEGSVRLAITAAPDARAASNALLAELETALGVDGQLTLHVVPLTPSPSSKPP